MNVGFRPRLKARPSLYNLLRSRKPDPTAPPPLPAEHHHELPALPPSPSKSTHDHSYPPFPTPSRLPVTQQSQASSKMAPKKPEIDDDGEEQYGACPRASAPPIEPKLTTPGRLYLLGFWVRVVSNMSACVLLTEQARRHRREYDWSCHVRAGKDGTRPAAKQDPTANITVGRGRS